jgi:large conductance mechanosensitive channel
LLHNTENPRVRGRHVAGVQTVYLSRQVLDLAVAVVMGVAFGAVVTALVKDLITPLIAAIVGKPDFSAIEFTVNGSKFPIGDFINALVSFILIAAAVYFFIVLPMNTIVARMRRGEAAPDPTTKKCPECLSDVPIAARLRVLHFAAHPHQTCRPLTPRGVEGVRSGPPRAELKA